MISAVFHHAGLMQVRLPRFCAAPTNLTPFIPMDSTSVSDRTVLMFWLAPVAYSVENSTDLI